MGMLSKQEVTKRTTLSPATIWRRIQVGDFPKPIQLTPNRIAWTEESIEEWEQSRPAGQCELPTNFKKELC
jgi:prophage regulatory protein